MDMYKLFAKFLPNEEIVGYKNFGNGLINSTFLFTARNGKRYIVQNINHNVFKNVDMLMNNMELVTDYLRKNNVETINLLKTAEGKSYVLEDGLYFRMYEFVPNTMTFESTNGSEMTQYAAEAFGKFHKDLAGFDGSLLGETIPFFHDTAKRYEDFLKAVSENKFNRVYKCVNEVNEIKKYASYYSLIVDAIKNNEVLLHVTHNDPKINNALFDSNTFKFRCIIDLDTVMPGSFLYDVGDALRSLFTGDKEDSLDYKNVVVNLDTYATYIKAYLKEMNNSLTPKELELLPYAPFILSMELSMRFLTDYINGDVYFSCKREGHNLDRARTQLNLGKSILENIDELKKITKEALE